MPDSLAIRYLLLRRTPGFPHGGPELRDLSPGINVVFGPQQSGKTSIVEAIQWLLWPRTAHPHAGLSGSADVGAEPWSVELDGSRTQWLCSGRESAPPPLPPAEQRDRYRLVLPELLLAGDNQNFAEAIARESAGGYDLAAAAAAIGVRNRPTPAGSVQKGLQAARHNLKEVRAREREIREEEARLPEMRRRAAAADSAAAEVRLLELAMAHARSAERAREAGRRVAEFPPEMERLQADDAQRLAQLGQTIARVEGEINGARAATEAADEALRETRLEEGVSTEILEALLEESRLADEVDREVERLERQRSGERRVMDGAATAFGGVLDAERLARLDLERFRDLEGLSLRATELRQRRAAVEAILAGLKESGAPPDPDRLVEATLLLSQWLRSPDPDAARRATRIFRLGGVAALVACALLALLLGVLVHSGFYLLVPLALVFGTFVFGRRSREDGQVEVARRLRELALAEPTSWRPGDVFERLREIDRERAAAEAEANRRRRREEGLARLTEIEAGEKALAESARGITTELGLPWKVELESLHWLTERIVRWRAAYDQHLSTEGELDEAREQRSRRLGRIATTLQRYGYEIPIELLDARAGVANLKGRFDRWQDGHRARLEARGRLRQGESDLASAERARRELRERLGIEATADAQIEDWCSRLEPYRKARNDLTEAVAEARFAREAIESGERFEEGLLESPGPVLEEALERHRARAEEPEAIRKAITATETRVADALRKHDVEAALAGVVDAEEALRDARDRDIDAVVGQRLVDFVREKTRDARRPEVFRAAQGWFARITRGRCELEFDEGEPAAFRARDTATGVGHALAELSGGTRVQLFLAVRAAFVETQERGLRLPLLLDETLATADDQRAAAIIDAVIEMARGGRQVFYFTAQADEVLKWQAALRDERVPSRVVDLRTAQAASVPPPVWLELESAVPAIPDAAGHDRDSYGRALGVEGIDPLRDEVERVHLWHFLDAPSLLRRCLALGIERLGPLRVYLEHAGGQAITELEANRRTIEAKAKGLAAFISGYRIGRGVPVDRPALERSDAVSAAFIDRVASLAREIGGDARVLVARLEGGAVRGFGPEKLDRLREFLSDQGYLDLREPLSPEELRARVLAAVSGELRDGLLSGEDVHRLLQCMTGPRPAATGRREPVEGGAQISLAIPSEGVARLE